MSARLTPYRQFRYPFTSDTIDAVSIQTLAEDIDQALVDDDKLRTDAFRLSSAQVAQSGTPSITKATITAITWNGTTGPNNGANGAFGTSAWWSSTTNPSRLTAPASCLVYATAAATFDPGASLGANGFFELMITKNGATLQPNIQTAKYQCPIPSPGLGQVPAVIESLWSLVAGDYLEAKVLWSGTPAGPLPLAAFANMGVVMIAVP